MNKREKQSNILNVLKINKVGIGALLENKLKKEKIDDMMIKLICGWEYYSSSTSEGRILVLWRKSFTKVQVLLDHHQLVHCSVKITGMTMEFLVTFVYGLNTLDERLELWRGLSCIHVINRPWLIMGDFTAVFNFDDRAGGRTISAAELLDSNAWLAHSQLVSLKRIGSNFTWSNKQDGGDMIYSKIDHVGFKEVVLDSWNKPLAARGLLGVTTKLLRLNHVLKAFNREEIGDVEQSYHQAKGDYQLALTRAQAAPTDLAVQEAEKAAAIRYQDHADRYRSFLIQRSKITWLRKGDDNNAYFHACIKKGREENRIVSFLNERGDIIDDYEAMLRLTRDFGKSDVKKALLSIPGIKSPGPDGFGSEFFKTMCLDTRDIISDAVLGFFRDGKIPEALNETALALVPKTDSPSRAVDYRPIACCNTLYKCI
ncbi:uncharacterized protein LOC133822304 [Humulus lupulus]|uniref:uncharacterized protein LOC133822304 n=1 Tax=Humulus lupulus TaxID=3486 RepID=UPI002B411945|nr:uncharacterized protein LOC133822304 [Humulus lupulus]